CYLIDEVVAVGDKRFNEKCKIELFEKRKDKSMIIVSHSPTYIKEHCNKASVLIEGKMKNFDDVDEAYKSYNDYIKSKAIS
ncbi:MAG: ABC transporter ATP-binding protein, partial [Epsilonproteobacteria bacterium]|nr:ABC transporter ATP-binding protein [Campylobacterota bacterium]